MDAVGVSMLVIMFRNGFRRLWRWLRENGFGTYTQDFAIKAALSDGKLDAENGMVSCKACGWVDTISFLASDLVGNFFSDFQENEG